MSPVRQAWRSSIAIIIGAIVTAASFRYSYNAKAESARAYKQSANEAEARAAQFKAEADARNAALEEQSSRLRFAFCGLQPYSAITTPAPTESAQTLRDAVKNATSPRGLNCTPDPNDGK